MPSIRLSTRTIQPASMPTLRMGSGWQEGMAANDRAIRANLEAARTRKHLEDEAFRSTEVALFALNKMKDAVRRSADREADEAATVWEAQMLNAMNGSVDANGNHTGGIAQKTWRDYEGRNASPMTDLGEVEKSFQASDTYKNMSGMARERFNNRVMVRRAQYLASANRIYDRNRAARTQFFDQQADLVSDRRVETTAFADDDTFTKTMTEESFRKTGRKFRDAMQNPDIIDSPYSQPKDIVWKDDKTAAYFNLAVLENNRKMAIARCDALAKNAAMGKVDISGGIVSMPMDNLEKAETYAGKLVGCGLISKEDLLSLDYKFRQARSQIDENVKKTVSDRTAAAMAKGDVGTLENARREMEAAGKQFEVKFPNGSVGQTVTLLSAQKLDEQAEKRAKYDLMNDLANGVELEDKEGRSLFDPVRQARYHRLYPEVKKAWDEKVQKAQTKEMRANHDMNVLEARMKMMEMEAPQEFYNYLADQVVNKKLYARDFATLQNEYRNGWVKGYKGQGAQPTRQMQLAGDMLNTVKTEIGVDLYPAFQRNDDGTLKLDQKGLLKLDEKGDRPDVTYERNRDWIWDKTEKFTTEEMTNILNTALTMANLDGMEIDFDPSNPSVKLDKPHKVNALNDFATFVRGLKDEKRVLSAADEMARRAQYMNNVRLEGMRQDEARVDKMKQSKPVSKTEEEETEE